MTDEQIKSFEDKVEGAMTSVMEKQVPIIVEKHVQEKLEAAIKQLELDKKEIVPNVPLGVSNEGLEEITKKQKFASLIKGIAKKDYKVLEELGVKGMVEGTDSDGGFLVPEEFMNAVDRVKLNVGLVRSLARRIPMTRDTMNMPTLGTSVTVEWAGEANEGTDSSPTLKNVKLLAKTAIGLCPVSNELLQDANVDVVDFLMELFAEALAQEEDNQALNGVGAPFTGILNDANVGEHVAATGNVSVATLDLKDYRDAMTDIKQTISGGAVWVMHPTVWSAVQTTLEGSQSVVNFTNYSNVLSNTLADGMLTPAGMLWDRPVYVSDLMPTAASISTSDAVAIFGNFNYFYFGDRQQMTLDVSKEATIGGVNLFSSNQSGVRVTERVALAIGVGEAFTVLKTAAA